MKRYNFKIGDKVITATGQIGVIKDICDCKYCKEREFLEPIVETEIGADDINYITIQNLENNFKDFYQIGDYIFGNLDEANVEDNILDAENTIKNLQSKIEQFKIQKEIILKIKMERYTGKRADLYIYDDAMPEELKAEIEELFY